MSSKRLPRSLIVIAATAAAITTTMLSVFFLQYRWLANELTAVSTAEHNALLNENFAYRARAQLHSVADGLTELEPRLSRDTIAALLDRRLTNNPSLKALRYSGPAAVTAGRFPAGDYTEHTTWLHDALVIRDEVAFAERPDAEIEGVFALDELRYAEALFAERVAVVESRIRRQSYAWIAGTAALVLTVSGLFALTIHRSTSGRIQQLTEAAEQLRDADFGSPMPVTRNDDLGDLARVFNDMRERLKATTISRDYVDGVLGSMNEAIVITDDDGRIKRINKAATRMLGYEEHDLIGNLIDYIVNTDKSRSLIGVKASPVPRKAFLQSRYGESIPVSFTCSILTGEAGDRIYAAQDTTERLQAEKRIRYLARIDPLTKIPNRMQFQHLLQRAIARARRDGRPLCLFYIDIDYFKEINDTFGHLAGDTTLETVAKRMASVVPENTIFGRLAGDEFAIIFDDCDPEDRARAAKTATALLNELAEPLVVQGHEVFMTASMGMAYYPRDAANVIDLIRNADAALYRAKKAGGNRFETYVPEMNEAAVERLMTKSKLKRSFERDELLVHYQPKYKLKTGEVFGAEALVRWELPERGLILPSDFIPIAEETNLIVEIGEWVLDKVCEDFCFWQRSVPSPGRISVNLSLKQLRQANFIRRISSILRKYEVSPTSLELEITETTLMEDPKRTITILNQLYALGLHLAIDDFGTGYSSLSALQQFPINTLKIDKSFVRHAATNADDATIVGTIVHMGKNLNMDVVAEGVESEEQLVFLQELGCNYAQGLLFGDPMDSERYLDLLSAQADGTNQHRALFLA